MLKATYPYFIANKPEAPNQDLAVYDKFSGELATQVAMADANAIDRAIAAADAAADDVVDADFEDISDDDDEDAKKSA